MVGHRQEDRLAISLTASRGVQCSPASSLLSSLKRDQLFKDRSHRVIVHGGKLHRAIAVQHRVRAEVNLRIEELGDQMAEGIRLGKRGNLIAKFEVVEDVLDVGGEAVEVGNQNCRAGAGPARSRTDRDSVNSEVL